MSAALSILPSARARFRSRFARPEILSAFLVLTLAVTAMRATSVVPPEFPSLVNQSDYIVRAVVKSVRAERETGGRKIHTFVELEVLEVIAGTPPAPLVLRLLGGKVDEEEMLIDGAPKFQVGDEDILFVRGNGRMAYPLVGIMHGRFPIRQDATTRRRYMIRNNGSPLQSTAEVAQPMTAGPGSPQQQQARAAQALTPDQFIQQIKQVAKTVGQHELEN